MNVQSKTEEGRPTFYRKVMLVSVEEFFDKSMLTQAAAISYYTVFSLPSILLIVLWAAAHFYKESAVYEEILHKLTSMMGEQVAHQVMSTIQKLSIQEPTLLATIAGIGMLLFLATTVFDAMRTALNQIAEAKAPASVGKSIWMAIRIRLRAFAILLSISFFLLVFMVINFVLTSLSDSLTEWFGSFSEAIMIFDAFMLDFAATTMLFMLYFRYLPDIRLKWADVFWGALLTATLFIAGKGVIGFFIGQNSVVDLYDAAGSLLVMMLWVYYASALFLFGATFTFVRVKEKEKITMKNV